MDDTEYSITWRGRRIPYSIRRHGKRIFPGVIVLPGGKVEVLAPPDFDHASAGELVTEEAPWIVQRLAGIVCRYAAAPHEFVTGESIAYLGRSYRLKVLPGESGRMKLRHRCLEVSVETETRQAVRAALASWFRGKAEERFPQQVEAWHEVVGGPAPTVVISNQRKRLASCERDGTIRLNWRLIQVPDWMTDYAVVRQLVRLWHPGPGRDFWQAFERVMPDCRFRREALRREEPGHLPKPGAFQPALDLDGYPAPHPDDTKVHLEMAYELARAVIEQARVAEQAKERLTALDLERYQARLLRRGWGTCEEREERMLRDIGRLPRDEAEIEPHRQEALEVQAVACGSWRAAVGKMQQYHGMIIPMCKVIATMERGQPGTALRARLACGGDLECG